MSVNNRYVNINFVGVWVSFAVSVGGQHLLGAHRHSLVHTVEGQEGVRAVLASQCVYRDELTTGTHNNIGILTVCRSIIIMSTPFFLSC